MSIKSKRWGLIAFYTALLIIGNSHSTLARESARTQTTIKVHITLSSKARHKMNSVHENISLSASWYGCPLYQWKAAADITGKIELGRTETTLTASESVAELYLPTMHRGQSMWLKDGIHVYVNAYSARHRLPDNILDCDIIAGPLSGRSPIPIRCSLISERAQTHIVEP